jgi:hypothetical protein
MNNIAISPHIGMYALQLQNVKRNSVKKLDISELNGAPNMKEEKENEKEQEEEEVVINEETL